MILCVQHVEPEKPGRIRAAIADHGLSMRTVRTFAGEPVPRSMRGFDGLVVMGGPMGVNDSARLPHIRAEMRLIENALAREIPMLGICLGSQLLAAVLGAKVKAGPKKEIGWFPVTLTSRAKKDPLFAGVRRRFTALHWHGDIFELPNGAVPLASSSLTRYQAFRWGAAAYGILFHLEATPSIVAGMTRTFAGELIEENVNAKAVVAEARRRNASLDKLASRVFDRWVDLVR